MRSLSFLGQQLSCGTGYGRVSFYDLRASAWMDLDLEPDAPPRRGAGARRPRGYQQLGPGWLCQTDSVYMYALTLPDPGDLACARLTVLEGTHFATNQCRTAWCIPAPGFLCKRSGVPPRSPRSLQVCFLALSVQRECRSCPKSSCISQVPCALHVDCDVKI